MRVLPSCGARSVRNPRRSNSSPIVCTPSLYSSVGGVAAACSLTDSSGARRRLLLSTATRTAKVDTLHTRLPLGGVITDEVSGLRWWPPSFVPPLVAIVAHQAVILRTVDQPLPGLERHRSHLLQDKISLPGRCQHRACLQASQGFHNTCSPRGHVWFRNRCGVVASACC